MSTEIKQLVERLRGKHVPTVYDCMDVLDALEAAEPVVEALREIARQKLHAEITDSDPDEMDWLGGYEECVKRARAALTAAMPLIREQIAQFVEDYPLSRTDSQKDIAAAIRNKHRRTMRSRCSPEPVAWMLKTGHGTTFRETLTPEMQELEWAGKPAWKPLYAAAPVPASPSEQDREFKNFHRMLCERFDYTHDEKDWKRDQVSLMEWIAKRPASPSGEEPS